MTEPPADTREGNARRWAIAGVRATAVLLGAVMAVFWGGMGWAVAGDPDQCAGNRLAPGLVALVGLALSSAALVLAVTPEVERDRPPWRRSGLGAPWLLLVLSGLLVPIGALVAYFACSTA